MRYIDNNGITNPEINLALEEFVLRNFPLDSDYLLFYINEPSIIIGRNQNTLEEINQKYINEKGIHVVRRISGGGAVYHDLGNLNFSFITNHDSTSISNFKKFTAPVIQVLNQMGIKAELKGRNDILVEDKKISGTAQFSTTKRMVSHGTLLFNTDLEEVAKALNVKMSKIVSKGHKSVRSRVANIVDYLDEPISIDAFKKKLLEGLNHGRAPFTHYLISKKEWDGVNELRDRKYGTWEWNYGQSPDFNIQRVKRFPIGEIDLRLEVEKGIIKHIRIYGDFFGFLPVSDIEESLKNRKYTLDSVTKQLSNFNMKDYFGDLSTEEFIELVYGDDE